MIAIYRNTMKINILSFAMLCLLLFQGCNSKPKHPQAGMASGEGATGMNDKSILSYSASIDRNINHFNKQYSLIYTSGDLSMYAEKYSGHSDGMLYKTFSANGTLTETVKSFYFKNDSLILVKEHTQLSKPEGQVQKDTRTYLRNNIAFKMESRTASSPEAIRTLPYLLIQPADQEYATENYPEQISMLENAIKGTDKFEMIFQNISTYPDASYILLKGKNAANYTASIRVKDKDAFIDSLLHTPSIFKEEKLRLKWKIADKEAVYVPVADTVTSARGLNR